MAATEVLRGLTLYLLNLSAAVLWCLFLLAGSLLGFDRRRLARLLLSTRRGAPKARPTVTSVVRQPKRREQELLAVGSDVASALRNLGVSKSESVRVARSAAQAGHGEFQPAFDHALRELGYPGGVQ